MRERRLEGNKGGGKQGGICRGTTIKGGSQKGRTWNKARRKMVREEDKI